MELDEDKLAVDIVELIAGGMRRQGTELSARDLHAHVVGLLLPPTWRCAVHVRLDAHQLVANVTVHHPDGHRLVVRQAFTRTLVQADRMVCPDGCRTFPVGMDVVDRRWPVVPNALAAGYTPPDHVVGPFVRATDDPLYLQMAGRFHRSPIDEAARRTQPVTMRRQNGPVVVDVQDETIREGTRRDWPLQVQVVADPAMPEGVIEIRQGGEVLLRQTHDAAGYPQCVCAYHPVPGTTSVSREVNPACPLHAIGGRHA